MANTQEKKTWYVQREGWVLGEYRKVNDPVEATEDEVKYLRSAGNLAETKIDKRKVSSPSPAPDTSTTSETPASRAVAEKTKA